MSTLIFATRSRFGQSERVRVALLSGVSFVLGLTFLALLVADEARAAGL